MVIRMNDYVEERISGPDAHGRTYSRELSIDGIYRQEGHAVVGDEGLLRQERVELSTNPREYYDKRGHEDTSLLLEEAGIGEESGEQFYKVSDEETYYVEFAEVISVPDGLVGIVSPQENVLRAGVMMHSSLMGPGEDTAEALMHIKNNTVLFQEGSNVAELVVFDPDEDATVWDIPPSASK